MMTNIISSFEIEKASVLIKCGDDQGTGFYISKDIILTARHVVIDNIENQELITINSIKDHTVSILAHNKDLDVCIIKVNVISEVVLPVKNINQSFNQPCSIFGFPYMQDVSGTHFSGRIDKLEFTKHWDFSIKCEDVEEDFDYSGLSGGAIISDGQVIGVALLQNSKSIRAVSIRKIETFVTDNGIEVNQYFSPSEIPIQLKEVVDNSTTNYSVFEELSDKLNKVSGWFLTYGVPGSGKTTFIASYPNGDNVKICGRYFAKIPNDNLSKSIRTSNRYFITWLEDSITSALAINIDVLTTFEDRVKRIPSLLDSLHNKMNETHYLFLIDGLDEIENLNSLLGIIPIELPQNVSFILSCTDIDILPFNIKSKLSAETIVEVSPLDISQCEVYLSERLLKKKIKTSAIQNIAEKSEGHPLYLQYLIKYLLTYDIPNEKLDEWIDTIPVIGGEIVKYYEMLWSNFFNNECKLWIVLTLSQLRTKIDQGSLIEMLPDQFRLSYISNYKPIRYLFKGEDSIELYHNSFKDFISSKTSSYISIVNNNILEFCQVNLDHQYSIENILFHMVKSNTPQISLHYCNQEWADKCAQKHVSPDLIISDIKNVKKYAIDSSKPVDVINLLLLLQRIEFRYDSVFVDNATSIAAALIALGEFSSSLKYLLRDKTLLISDEDVMFFLQAFYENDALEEGDKLLEAFNKRYRRHIQEKSEKDSESFSLQPFIHKVRAHTLSVKSFGKEALLQALNILSQLRKFQDHYEAIGDIEAFDLFYSVRENAAAWHYAYVLRDYDYFQDSQTLSELMGIEVDEKWARLRALSILFYEEFNIYSLNNIEKSEAYFNTIQDIEWLIENYGYDSKKDTILLLLKSLIHDSKNVALLNDLICKYKIDEKAKLVTIRKENGVDLDYQEIQRFYFDSVLKGYITSKNNLILPSINERRLGWESYYIQLLEQVALLEGILIKNKIQEGNLMIYFPMLKAILSTIDLRLMERAHWERSYLLPEDLIPLLYNKISNLWCRYFSDSINFFIEYICKQSVHQLGVYTEGYRNSISSIIRNMSKWNISTSETITIIKLLEKHILHNVQNRWERTAELLDVVEYYAIQGFNNEAELIFTEMLKTSMGPSWYKEAQLQLLNTSLKLNCGNGTIQKYFSKFASLLDYAAGEMTFQRYIRYDKESFIGELISKGSLGIGIEYIKFETIPPYKVLNDNAEQPKIDSLALGYGNIQGARNIAIQSAVLEILRNCKGLNSIVKVALCNIFTLNDDIFRYINSFSKQMAISINEISNKSQREQVYPLISELIESKEMKDDWANYILIISEELKSDFHKELYNHFKSKNIANKFPKNEEKVLSESSQSDHNGKDNVFHIINKKFEVGFNQHDKDEIIESAIDAFNKENISLWYSNWSDQTEDLKQNLKEVFNTAEYTISKLSIPITNYGVNTWTVIDKLLWFSEHNLKEEQAVSILESISHHFELLIRPDEHAFNKYEWINSFQNEKSIDEQVISFIVWLTTHPLHWVNKRALSCLKFLSKNIPELAIPVLIIESASDEPSRKGQSCCDILFEVTKESPKIIAQILSNRKDLIEEIIKIQHLSIFKIYSDIGNILVKYGYEELNKKLQSILPDVNTKTSEVVLEEPMLETIQIQIDKLNMMEILDRNFCKDILNMIPDFCAPSKWTEVVKSDMYLKRSYHEEPNYIGRFPELVKYALNKAIMSRTSKSNIDDIFNAINQN